MVSKWLEDAFFGLLHLADGFCMFFCQTSWSLHRTKRPTSTQDTSAQRMSVVLCEDLNQNKMEAPPSQHLQRPATNAQRGNGAWRSKMIEEYGSSTALFDSGGPMRNRIDRIDHGGESECDPKWTQTKSEFQDIPSPKEFQCSCPMDNNVLFDRNQPIPSSR